jgi:hypothetical protein
MRSIVGGDFLSIFDCLLFLMIRSTLGIFLEISQVIFSLLCTLRWRRISTYPITYDVDCEPFFFSLRVKTDLMLAFTFL